MRHLGNGEFIGTKNILEMALCFEFISGVTEA